MAEYMISVWHDDFDNVFANDDEMQAAFEAVSKFNDKIQAEGLWVFGGGLEMPDTATCVDNTTGTVVMTDGPFAESKEQLGGFWVLNCKDLDHALTLAAEASAACRGKVEVRPFQG